MKLFWKQFVGILCLVLLLFSIFGSILLYSSFQMSLNEEKSRITEEISMFQYAILSSVHSLPKDYEAVDYAVGQIGESIVDSLGNPLDVVRIYEAEGNLVYESSQSTKDTNNHAARTALSTNEQPRDWQHWNENQGSYSIEKKENRYFLQSLSLMKHSRGNYYLEINRDISHIYENRERLYQQYKIVLIIVIGVSAMISFIFSMGFTRPIRRLSKETRRFAAGNYESRVRVSGNDEVTALMKDFNEMADRLQDNMTELKNRARQQEEFTAAFAHELKTPLTSIVGYADMLRSMELSAEDINLCGNYIFQQGKRLERLSYKMLELVGIDKQQMHVSRISVEPLVHKAFYIMKTSLQEKELQWSCQIEEADIQGDEDLLLSLLCNLIDNSRKACEEQGEIWCYGQMDGASYVLVIKDNGRGIPKEDLEKIKEAFYMVDKSRARREGGAGIGLALCEKIIRVHQGEWHIDSQTGEGTEIVICFPLAKELQDLEGLFMEDSKEESSMETYIGEEDADNETKLD